MFFGSGFKKKGKEDSTDEIQLFLMEAKEHFISEDCGKHKLQLLSFVSIAVIFSLLSWQGIEVQSFLGIKLSENIPAVYLSLLMVPPIVYQIFMYYLKLSESYDSWCEKFGLKEKPVEEVTTIDCSEAKPDSRLDKFNCSLGGNKFVPEGDFKSHCEQLINKKSYIPGTSQLLDDSMKDGIEKLKTTVQSLETKLSGVCLVDFASESKRHERYLTRLEEMVSLEMTPRARDFRHAWDELKRVSHTAQDLKNMYDSFKDIKQIMELVKGCAEQNVEIFETHKNDIESCKQQINQLKIEHCQMLNTMGQKLEQLSVKRSFTKVILPYYIFPICYALLVLFFTGWQAWVEFDKSPIHAEVTKSCLLASL